MSTEENIIKPSIPYTNPQDALFSGERWENLGSSAGGHTITGNRLLSDKNSSPWVLLLGGVHGNETEGVRFMEEFTREFVLEKETSPFPFNLYTLPLLNPDGFLSFERQNANSVDLNRNMSTKDWNADYTEERYRPGSKAQSEPETVILINLLNEIKPDYIISFHSWKPMINTNGPSQKFASLMTEKMDMIIADDIGYPTPGSLGTYAGLERQIPTITLEFERGIELDTVYPFARDAVLNSFNAL